MVKVFGVFVAGCAATICAAPAVAAELTPDGPATLMNRWSGASSLEGVPPDVIVGARIVVGEGGREGVIRIRARRRGTPSQAGDPVLLPATPGTYDFAAPHVGGDYRELQIGIDQTVGGHAIIDPQQCTPERGPYGDICQASWLDILTGDPDGPPTESRGGKPLAIAMIREVDVDEDLRGDKTEDRTDLVLSAGPTTRSADGRLQTAITTTNRGPLTADVPRLETPAERWGSVRPAALATPTLDGWNECGEPSLWSFSGNEACHLGPLAPGESQTRTLTSSGPVQVVARAEGADLQPADNTVQVTGVTPSPPTRGAAARSSVKTAGRQTLRRGLKLTVAGEGRTRVTAVFKVRGGTIRLARTVTLQRDVARTVTLKATGAKLRALRRAAKRGTLRATITTRDANGTTASTSVTIR